MGLRVAFRTLGCKLNQLETESLADAFRKAGWEIQMGPATLAAELLVVNSCTVTGKAEQKARRLVRQALAANPASLAIVTGCYAQVEAAALASLHERAVIVPGDEKALLLALPGRLAEEWQGHGDLRDAVLESLGLMRAGGTVTGGRDPFAFFPEEFSFHSRPSLKVEDGCDNRCSYCRVRIARGPSRSLPSTLVLERLRSLEAAGKAEAVLTGVNLHQYDDGGLRLPGLLRLLLAGTRSIALRLSSWEPEGVDAEFLEVFAERRIRPHIHLPVQSGADSVLRGMARAYRREKVLAACEALRRVREDPFIAADLIAGFPGEGEGEFAETLDLARRCDFAWIHAFPFSPRPGTAAWDLRPRVPERVAGERVAVLGDLAREGRRSYVARQVGRELEAILETGRRGAAETGVHATSENYLKLRILDLPGEPEGGRAIRCRVEAPVTGAAPKFPPDPRRWRAMPPSPVDPGIRMVISPFSERETAEDEAGDIDISARYRGPIDGEGRSAP